MIESVLNDESIALRPTVIRVDLDALHWNVRRVRERVGTAHIMATVKANAYGHGLIRTSQELLLAGVDALGVAFLEEGITLRRAGITCPILVMGGIIGNQIGHFIEYELDITASSVYKLRQIDDTARAMGRHARVQIKIDTGMGRIGIRPENAPELFDAALRANHCEIHGVFSHFAASHDPDTTFTKKQLDIFLETIEYFPTHGHPMPIRHIANSGAVLQHPEAILDMVRPGIMLYGVHPGPEASHSVELHPVLSMLTRVVVLKVGG